MYSLRAIDESCRSDPQSVILRSMHLLMTRVTSSVLLPSAPCSRDASVRNAMRVWLASFFWPRLSALWHLEEDYARSLLTRDS